MTTITLPHWDILTADQFPVFDVKLTISPDRIDLSFGDGRELWIENNEGTLVVHAYVKSHDEPVNIRILGGGVVVDCDGEVPLTWSK